MHLNVFLGENVFNIAFDQIAQKGYPACELDSMENEVIYLANHLLN